MKMRKLLLAAMAAWAASATAAEVVVNVENVRQAKGDVFVIVYDSKEHFLHERKLEIKAPATVGSVKLVIADLPPGEYALSAFHDVDGDGKLARNFIGIPKEPAGFSNDAVPSFGPPKYIDAKVTIPTEGATLSVKLH